MLLSWRLPPAFDPTSPTPAEQSADHRLDYLDYEGPVSAGRGVVARWDGGELEWEHHSADELRVRQAGTHLRGAFRLLRVGGAEWVLEWVNPGSHAGGGWQQGEKEGHG